MVFNVLLFYKQGLKMKCCQNGKFLKWDYPARFKPMLEVVDRNLYDLNFVHASNQYNNILSMGAVGVDNGRKFKKGWDKIIGEHSVRLSGRTYHVIKPSDAKGGIQYFLHDGRKNALSKHGRERDVDAYILEELYNELMANNDLCIEFQSIGRWVDQYVKEFEKTAEGMDGGVKQLPMNLLAEINECSVEFDIAAVLLDSGPGEHVIHVRRRNSRTTIIDIFDDMYEPLSYPLLFQHGEQGWGWKARFGRGCQKVFFGNYLSSRMLLPEKVTHDEYDFAEHPSIYHGWLTKDNKNFFPCNRTTILTRLGQTYLVDQISRCIDFQLNFQKEHKGLIMFGEEKRKKLLGELSDAEEEEVEEDCDSGMLI